ncbi:MAG: penicillin-binding protein 2 [Candidatus Omnitrophica bacterium]|nr:penicillin-binding protein 2 [Candidatus Omnitrophota bacterium]MBU1869962.1 penicillin-binding protein 2 [Candidatus Omnitrophota bacterium]
MTRIKITIVAIIILFLFLFAAVFNITVIESRKYRLLSQKNCIRLLPQMGSRGKILDREGNILATSKLSYDFMVLPQSQSQLQKIFDEAGRVLSVNPKNLRDAYRKGFYASTVPVTIAKNVGPKRAIVLGELKQDYPGVIIQPNPVRDYPNGRTAAHALGYLNEIDRWRLTKLEDYGYKKRDIIGFGGIEEKYDYYLRQEEGGLSIEVDHVGRLVRVLGFKSPRNGKDIQLTLNLKIQKIVDDNLAGRKGCVIIMDPNSGEVLALASGPNFSPLDFSERNNAAINSYFNNRDSPMLNRAISGTYPPGSVFKPVVAAAALEDKKINLNTTFLCKGSTLVGRKQFNCWSVHNEQNLIEALQHSCNVFFYRTGLLIGPQSMHDYALKFGFSRPTGFELPYETSGYIPSPLLRRIHQFRKWYNGDTANLSIGQGDVLVTPLQIARMMAVFANNGYLVTPYIVKAIDGRDISVYQRRLMNIGVKKETLNAVKEGLKRVVSQTTGTGNVLSGLPVAVAGKTGTAQASGGNSHAWFAGYFPVKNPKYVVCVFIERGGPGYTSCVVARSIIEAMANQGLI